MEQSFSFGQEVPREKFKGYEDKAHIESEYEKLLKGLVAFRRKLSDNRAELQILRDNETMHFKDIEEEYAEKEIFPDERMQELEFWLAHEMPSEELEQIRLFEEAGYVPWTNMNGEINFLKNSPEDMSALSKEETLSLYRSWQNAGKQMMAETQCIDERLRQVHIELSVQKSEHDTGALDRIAGNQEKWLSVPLEKVIEDFLGQKKRLAFLLEGLQGFMNELLPVAKKFGYIPNAPASFSHLVKQEMIQ